MVFRAGSPSEPPSVVLLDLSTRSHRCCAEHRAVADRPEIKRYFTQVRPIEFETSNGKTAFGLFYPPQNPDIVRRRGRNRLCS